MALTHWGFIYTAAGAPAEGRVTVEDTGECRTVLVGVAKTEQAIPVAKQLVADGVQLIELCGGFGPIWTARILEAIDNAVPIGSVAYGPESVDGVHAIFS
ncbi:DUF6506 family protein [Pseudonocardia spinosispora]|uniref:DUF6506 family protein n=1 Tax=Pseudonocardia spinosispora TaxID=103441 RepID=UPI00041537FC|nr:DUF6506 family protein [Pseudonocardia spinosispora]